MSRRAVMGTLFSMVFLGCATAVWAEDAKPAPAAAPSKVKPKLRRPKPTGKLVELNSATKAELKTLPGITDALADRIIAARPYYSKAKINDGVLPAGFYVALRDKIMVKPPPLPKK